VAIKTPTEATVEESIVLALFDLSNLLTKRGEALARASGLTTQQWILLLHIVGDPNFVTSPGDDRDLRRRGVLPSEIARARGVSRANVSSLLTGLLERGLVRQIKDKEDGRRKRLVATRAGEKVVEAIDPERRSANRRLLAGLDDGARRQFLEALTACLQVVRAGAAPDDDD